MNSIPSNAELSARRTIASTAGSALAARPASAVRFPAHRPQPLHPPWELLPGLPGEGCGKAGLNRRFS